MMAATVGVAIGQNSDVTSEAASVVIMGQQPAQG
jgi:cation transport ATPase